MDAPEYEIWRIVFFTLFPIPVDTPRLLYDSPAISNWLELSSIQDSPCASRKPECRLPIIFHLPNSCHDDGSWNLAYA